MGGFVLGGIDLFDWLWNGIHQIKGKGLGDQVESFADIYLASVCSCSHGDFAACLVEVLTPDIDGEGGICW